MDCQSGKIVFITGGNRGLGFETAKRLGSLGMTLLIGSRKLSNGQLAVNQLQALGYNAETIHYDAREPRLVDAVCKHIDDKYGKLDVLVNNAGILLEQVMDKNSSSSVSPAVLEETFQINVFAIVVLTQKLLPLIKKSDAGRIVNLSSILGSHTLHSMKNSPIEPAKAFAYNASKSALNAYTIHLAHELRDTSVKVNSAHPGWVKTELGGPDAPMEIVDSYKTCTRLATLDSKGPTGGFFHEEDTLPW
ncbi:MAG: NAD(P)-dependent dehydrogenase (short-subunit alcohol dehydrogenase family) [Porticoccus sp.]|jgi:NAD(P)-dependent dehydrogenase (short-subunit alcohol dehydrogenase family)